MIVTNIIIVCELTFHFHP